VAMTPAALRNYYDESYPPSVLNPPPPFSTGATAGAPGSWTPAGSNPPDTVADLIAGTPNVVTASPGTLWPTGDYVQTDAAGVGGQAHWSGTAWVAGPSPVVPPPPSTGADAGSPGTWTPNPSTPPATGADVIAGTPNAIVANPTTAWATGEYVEAANSDDVHWDGSDWVTGQAP
jgi:hypothetical protein